MFLCLSLQFVLAISAQTSQKSLKKCTQWMQGIFSSEAQSHSDSNYFHIVLKMKPIWKHSKDCKWLFVEQAMVGYEAKPYRQRVYKVTATDSNIVSDVYEFAMPLRFAGNPGLFEKTMTTDSLIHRQGCAVYLKAFADSFSGATLPGVCMSTLRGAKYATSKVNITATEIHSWDQGFDAANKQVWGAIKGPYKFVKKKKKWNPKVK